ncbi:MAG: sensor histidine kinase, partial [Actinomycetota bacterium]
VRDVRSYIFDLQPKVVRGRSLREAISELAKDLEVNTLADVKVDVSEDALGLDERQRSNLVQMVREVLSNIARHAQANEVSIACSTTDGYLEIEVIDDGVGFDPGAITRGHGLRNIEERAHRLGGRFDISPRRPRGTIHRISIPVVQG